MSDETTAKSRWGVLDTNRAGVLRRARQCSAITIPSALPPDGHTEDSDLKTPYQSLGARGVNNLASKMLLALLPSTTSFVRFRMDDELQSQLGSNKTAVEDSMRILENRMMRKAESTNLRTVAHTAIKHMIITGNGLLYLPKSGDNRMYRLNQFCVVRNAAGKVVELMIREDVTKGTLPAETLKACEVEAMGQTDSGKDRVHMFTWVRLQNGKHVYHQEINDHKVPGSEGQVACEESPFVVLRWSAVENEDYGRGLVEEYLGDLISLEGLSKSIIQFAAVASKIVLMLHPGALTDEDELASAESGDVIIGDMAEVDMLQLEKNADFQAAKAVYDDIALRLSHAFLLRSGTVRDAERVTAEEIRSQAQELEDVLGGVYTVQSVEFQLPVVRRLLSVMKKEGEFPSFPKKNGKDRVAPVIITGFEALGRGHELNKLRSFFADVRDVLGDAALQYFKTDGAIKQIAIAHNVEIEDIVKTGEDVAAENRQAQVGNLAEKAAGPVAGAMAANMTETPT